IKQFVLPAIGLFFFVSAAGLDAQPQQRQPPGDFGTDENFLAMPAVDAHRLRLLSPTVLELTLITTKPPEGRPEAWDFVSDDFALHLPDAGKLHVTANGTRQEVKAVGFKRRVLYAPLKRRDLRIGNYLYLELSRPAPAGA